MEKKSPVRDSLFWIKVFASSILLAIGIWLLFDKKSAEQLVLTVTGVSMFLFSVIRVYPLIKGKQIQAYKSVITIEIVLGVLVSALITYTGISHTSEKGNPITEFIFNNYRFFVGAIIYARGVIYLVGITFMKSKNTILKFVLNISLITLGTVFLARNISVSDLAMVVIILALLSGAYLAIDSGHTYYNYTRYKKEKEIATSKEKEVEQSKYDKEILEIPVTDEIGDRPSVS